MASDVSEFCKKCDTCQRVNNRLGKAKAELHPIPLTDVWRQIGIDLIGRYNYTLINSTMLPYIHYYFV